MKTFRYLAATALTALALPSVAHAQTGAAQPTTAADGTEVAAPEEEGIVVTGSRIKRPNYETLEPSTSVSVDYVEKRGITNIADALNEQPLFRGSVTPAGDQSSFGVGVNFVNGFGLGTNRTLTLFNSRRVVSSNTPTIFGPAAGGLQVDLNIIPVGMVDRVETIAIGGAPIYGTDAIAGVTNVILKQKYEGIDLRVTTRLTEVGDNFGYNLSGTFGTSFADGRGNIVLGLSYDDVDGVLSRSREFSRRQFFSTNNPTAAQIATIGPVGRTPENDGRVFPVPFNTSATDGIPGSVLVADRRIFTIARGGVIFSGPLSPVNTNLTLPNNTGLQFDQSGNLVPFLRGTRFNTGSGAIDASGGDGLSLADFGQITSELNRFSAMAVASYQITDSVRLFGEGIFYRADAKELVNQPIYNGFPFGGASGTLTFSVNDPRLTPQARAALATAGYTNTFVLSRASADIVTPRPTARTDLYRIVAGLDGDFGVLGREWNFEVYGSYGRNKSTFRDTQLNQQRFVNAINNCQVAPTVNATPGFTPIADAACVPLDLFGEGRSSAAAINYVTAQTTTTAVIEQYVANANIGGTLFNIWGGGVGVNVGYEHREERASFTPDPFLQQGLGRSVAILPVTGKYNVDEVFGEVIVPVVAPSMNIPLINMLEFTGRVRYVDNTVNGGFTSYTAGGRWQPIRDIEFRGNYTRSLRAPAIVELFSPRTNIFTFVGDLCSPTNIGGGPVPATRTRNCQAFLARYPGATPLSAASASVPGFSGGNPTLNNEIAESFSYGVVLKPSFIPRLTASADYVNIKVFNPISSLNAATIVSACFDNENFNTADPANGNAFCSLIRRDANGQVDSTPANPGVNTSFVNGKVIRFDGIQGRLDYAFPGDDIGIAGDFGIGVAGLYVRRRIVDTTGIAPVRTDGALGDPKFSGQLNLSYDNEAWGTYWSINFVGRQIPSRVGTADTSQFLRYPAYVTVNPSAYVRFNEKGRFVFSVTNLFNKQTNLYQTVDLLGRRYAVSFQHRF